MEINWNTDRLIVLYYPPGASGKFLHGCLAISTQVEFQHKDLLNKFVSSVDKFRYFSNLVAPPNGKRPDYDFGLGCIQLLNLSSEPEYNLGDTVKIKKQFATSTTLSKLTNGNNYFFIIVHDPAHLPLFLNIWPNSNIIQIHNSIRWINYRKIPLSTRFPLELFDNLSLIPDVYKNRLLTFNADSFFNKEMFINQLLTLYTKLNLNDFNSEYMERLFDLYIRHISSLNNR